MILNDELSKISEHEIPGIGIKLTKYETKRWDIKITEDLYDITGTHIKTIEVKDKDMVIADMSILCPYERLTFSFIFPFFVSSQIDDYVKTLYDLKNLEKIIKTL